MSRFYPKIRSLSRSISAFFKKTELKWALKTGIAAGLAFFLGGWLSTQLYEPGPTKLISGLWSGIAAIFVSQARIGGSFRAGWNRLFGTVIGAGLGALFAILFGVNAISLGFGIALSIMAVSFFNLRAAAGLTAVALMLVMVLWKLNPATEPWLFAFYRLVDATLGIFIAFLVAMLIWPERASKKLHNNMSQILSELHRLHTG